MNGFMLLAAVIFIGIPAAELIKLDEELLKEEKEDEDEYL